MINIQNVFPFAEPRETQIDVIEQIDYHFSRGKRFIVLQSPVGSGKSAIALAVARHFQSSYILTPRKSLQDQYYEDFGQYVTLLKGRAAYPCPRICTVTQEDYAIVQSGGSPMTPAVLSCARGPCVSETDVPREDREYGPEECAREGYPCPYQMALDRALSHPHVVCNLHSFIFQAAFLGRFQRRPVLIIDEAHDVEGIIRDFLDKTFFCYGQFFDNQLVDDFPNAASIRTYLLRHAKPPLEYGRSRDDPAYRAKVEAFEANVATITDDSLRYMVATTEEDRNGTRIRFKQKNIGMKAHEYMFDMADRVLLMSGTIYDHREYCQRLGINPNVTAFIDVDSEFPLETRPIVIDRNLTVNTSFSDWYKNNGKEDAILSLREVMRGNPDKGLIHASSYAMARELAEGLADTGRVITHEPHDFQSQLELFRNSRNGAVFISPVCSQGVDFKYDYARWQAIVRVPHPNYGDRLVSSMSFNWKNWVALVTFGQQIGRINRAPDDFGVTYLIDARFDSWIRSNRVRLPRWLREAIEIR